MSPTAINTYLACPRKFFLRYIKKLRTKPSIHLIRGSIVHKAISEFHQNQSRVIRELPQKMVDCELLNKFHQHWEKAKNELQALGLGEDQLRFYYDDSRRMMINFSNWLCKKDSAPVNSSEVKIFSNNLGMMGIIDAVHQTGEKVILVDYKTSKYPKITDDIMRQAALYALLYQDKHHVIPETVFIHFLTKDGDPEPIHIDEPLLEYGKILIESTREKTTSMDEETYPCTCGGFCERDFQDGNDRGQVEAFKADRLTKTMDPSSVPVSM